MNARQIDKSRLLLGKDTVEMLFQAHKDAMLILENLGVGCKQPGIQEAFKKFGKYSALFFIVISICYKINFMPNTNICFLSIKSHYYNQLNLLLIINSMDC